MHFRLAFLLVLSGVMLSSAASTFESRDDSPSSETRGRQADDSRDGDTGSSRSGYIIASS